MDLLKYLLKYPKHYWKIYFKWETKKTETNDQAADP